MSTDSLKDLLRERVAGETTTDLTRGAWRAGRRARRRRSLAVGGGVMAGAVAVSGGVAWVGGGTATLEPTPSTSTTEPAPPVAAGPDATFEGVDVWFSPDQAEERELPFVEDGPLPRTIDLDVRSKALAGPVVMAFALGESVLLMDASGNAVSLDISRLDDVALPHGYRVAPTSFRMLSPDGARLLFPQDGSVEVYEVATGGWTSIPVLENASYALWTDATTIAVPPGVTGGTAPIIGIAPDRGQYSVRPSAPPFDTRTAQPVGPTAAHLVSSAQVWGMGGIGLPHRDDAVGDPELMAVDVGGAAAVLSFTSTLGDGSDSRWKDCCLAVGWLDDRTVVYLSRQREQTLVAWTVGTDEFRRVATIEGGLPDAGYDAASFASFS